MKLVTAMQMKNIDGMAINQYNIPSILLMEHAALSVFHYITTHFGKSIDNKKVTIICGAGNNGGDGLALARQLISFTKSKVEVILLASEDKLTNDAKVYYEACKNIKATIRHSLEDISKEFVTDIGESDIIIDALFGTGLTRNLEGVYFDIIDKINHTDAYIISVDIPSGIDADTGAIKGIAVKADATITFQLPKLGMFFYPAIDYIGELTVANIGIPKELTDTFNVTTWSIDKEMARQLLPKRYTRSNKGTYGKVLLIGGQVGMSGAISLASLSALKVGAGVATAAVPKSICDILEQKLTEVMTLPLDDQEGHLAPGAAAKLKDTIEKYDIVAIGPGIGRDSGITQILSVVLDSTKPCVIDADALYALKLLLYKAKKREMPVIITPHPGEMSMLSQQSIPYILENSSKVALSFAGENNIITVLKTERTLIADPDGSLYINTTGNPGMAKAGSGDVLTGIISGLYAQGLSAKEAAILGVYLHGRSGDIMKSKLSDYAILPSDILKGVEEVFLELK